MTWRLARSLEQLRNQVNQAYPNRSKASDGAIGDAAHASSASDHNPNANGVVCAIDLTHDPANGFDAHALAEHLRTHHHPNLRYIISNARIAWWGSDWQWQPSSGHTQHVHISVGTLGVVDGQTYDRYDDTTAWSIKQEQGDDGLMPTTYQVALIYAQALLMRDMSEAEYNQFHVGKSRNQLFDEFNNSHERKDVLTKIAKALTSTTTSVAVQQELAAAIAAAQTAQAKLSQIKDIAS